MPVGYDDRLGSPTLEIRNGCVKCPKTPPQCKPCPVGQICILTTQSCDTCATVKCVNDGTKGLAASAGNTSNHHQSNNEGNGNAKDSYINDDQTQMEQRNAMIGGFVGGTLGLAIIIYLLHWIFRRKYRKADSETGAKQPQKDDLEAGVEYEHKTTAGYHEQPNRVAFQPPSQLHQKGNVQRTNAGNFASASGRTRKPELGPHNEPGQRTETDPRAEMGPVAVPQEIKRDEAKKSEQKTKKWGLGMPSFKSNQNWSSGRLFSAPSRNNKKRKKSLVPMHFDMTPSTSVIPIRNETDQDAPESARNMKIDLPIPDEDTEQPHNVHDIEDIRQHDLPEVPGDKPLPRQHHSKGRNRLSRLSHDFSQHAHSMLNKAIRSSFHSSTHGTEDADQSGTHTTGQRDDAADQTIDYGGPSLEDHIYPNPPKLPSILIDQSTGSFYEIANPERYESKVEIPPRSVDRPPSHRFRLDPRNSSGNRLASSIFRSYKNNSQVYNSPTPVIQTAKSDVSISDAHSAQSPGDIISLDSGQGALSLTSRTMETLGGGGGPQSFHPIEDDIPIQIDPKLSSSGGEAEEASSVDQSLRRVISDSNYTHYVDYGTGYENDETEERYKIPRSEYTEKSQGMAKAPEYGDMSQDLRKDSDYSEFPVQDANYSGQRRESDYSRYSTRKDSDYSRYSGSQPRRDSDYSHYSDQLARYRTRDSYHPEMSFPEDPEIEAGIEKGLKDYGGYEYGQLSEEELVSRDEPKARVGGRDLYDSLPPPPPPEKQQDFRKVYSMAIENDSSEEYEEYRPPPEQDRYYEGDDEEIPIVLHGGRSIGGMPEREELPPVPLHEETELPPIPLHEESELPPLPNAGYSDIQPLSVPKTPERYRRGGNRDMQSSSQVPPTAASSTSRLTARQVDPWQHRSFYHGQRLQERHEGTRSQGHLPRNASPFEQRRS